MFQSCIGIELWCLEKDPVAYMVPSGQQIVLLYPLMLTWPGVLPPSYLPVVVPVASSELPFIHVQEFHGWLDGRNFHRGQSLKMLPWHWSSTTPWQPGSVEQASFAAVKEVYWLYFPLQLVWFTWTNFIPEILNFISIKGIEKVRVFRLFTYLILQSI